MPGFGVTERGRGDEQSWMSNNCLLLKIAASTSRYRKPITSDLGFARRSKIRGRDLHERGLGAGHLQLDLGTAAYRLSEAGKALRGHTAGRLGTGDIRHTPAP